MRIGIIDTGISEKYSTTRNRIHIVNPKEGFDTNGHGTCVVNILEERVKDQDIFVYKLNDNKGKIKSDDLIVALQKIKKVKVDVLNLSLGILNGRNGNLKRVINEISESNTLIISAAENFGAISYPAAYENVLSVIWDQKISSLNSFITVKDKNANIHGFGNEFQAIGLNGVQNVSGSSFIAPVLVAKVINDKLFGTLRKNSVEEILKKFPSKVDNFFDKCKIPCNKKTNIIHNAIMFPFNKEIETILNNADQLNFNIFSVVDAPFGKYVGKSIDSVLYRPQRIRGVIHSFYNFDWSSTEYDTMIVGHLQKISSLYRINFLEEVKKIAKNYGKNLFLLDAEKSEVSVIGDVSRESVGNQALYAHSTPIVAVVGMQSKLGKADLELQLYKTLQDKGYDTAMFMSEPYYKLFQQKYGWINGFGTETIDWEKEIVGANYLMHKLDDEQHEIVVVGTQSQVIPMAYENIGFLPQGTQDILIATHPDAFILVISEQSTEKQISHIEKRCH